MKSFLIVCACSACLVGQVNADILRVDQQAAPAGDGSSWSRAFDSLTDALAAASFGDQLWVAGGEYVPQSPAGRDATFLIPNGVQVFGGFDGNESSFAQRGDPMNPQTILTGKLANNDQAYHVVSFNSAVSATTLDGFFITFGLADGTGTRADGAGIYSVDSSPTLANLFIDLCSADSEGGGIYLGGNTPAFASITDCTIVENAAGSSGGGMYSEINLGVQDTLFQSNEANAGGAVHVEGTTFQTFTDCEFRNNDAFLNNGGAALVLMPTAAGQTAFTRCMFRGNSGPQSGALAYTFSGSHRIISCFFLSNESTSSRASAVFWDVTNPSSTLMLENSLFSGNINHGVGSCIYNASQGTLLMQGCTVIDNSTLGLGNGGGILALDGTTTVDNSIIWGNTAADASGQNEQIFGAMLATLTVNRSIIQNLGGGASIPNGTGAISSNPLFVDRDGPDNNPGTPDDNVRLMEGSPAIDRGSNFAVGPFASTDLYGSFRFHDDTGTPDTGLDDGTGSVVDLGAAEFQGTTPSNCPADLTGDGTLDFFDVSAFLSAFATGDLVADFTGNGVLDFFDVSAFLSAFAAGCP